MASDLADHLDAKLAEALQIGATAIEAIETLEEELASAKAANETLEAAAANTGTSNRNSLAQHTRFSTTASKAVLQAVLSGSIQSNGRFRLMVKAAAAAANITLPAQLDVETLSITDCMAHIESSMFPQAQ